MKERWKSVIGYEGIYEVSDCGRVRRLVCRSDYGYKPITPRYRKVQIDAFGYPSVHLYRENKAKVGKLHILIAAAFIGPRPKGYVINHKDGNKRNCHPSNLEYITFKGNTQHAVRMGLVARGNRLPQTLLNPTKVREIRKLAAKGVEHKTIAPRFGISWRTVGGIVSGDKWSYV